jgi:hypothetical protein
VAFRLYDGSQAACSRCGRFLADRGGENKQPQDQDLAGIALITQKRITARINDENPERAQLEKALATLWAPLDHPAAARPVLALWFDEAGWRCPCEAKHAVGAEAPLGQLPVRWRLLTLLALHDVFGPDLCLDGAMSATAGRTPASTPVDPATLPNRHQSSADALIGRI